MNYFLSLLYTKPSFIEGIARIFDFGGLLDDYDFGLTAEQTDFLALSSDWYAIGLDLSKALVDFEQHLEKETTSNVGKQTRNY